MAWQHWFTCLDRPYWIRLCNYRLWSRGDNTFDSVCQPVRLGLWDLRCAPPRGHRTMLCTTDLRLCTTDLCCAPWCRRGTYVREKWGLARHFSFLVVHNVALYWLGGAKHIVHHQSVHRYRTTLWTLICMFIRLINIVEMGLVYVYSPIVVCIKSVVYLSTFFHWCFCVYKSTD